MIPTAVTHRCQRLDKIDSTTTDLVGVAGFEPTAPRSQSECATKLRHTPVHRLVQGAAYAIVRIGAWGHHARPWTSVQQVRWGGSATAGHAGVAQW